MTVDDREDDGRETYRVAVTVFMEAKGVDERDAANRAEMVVRNAMWDKRNEAGSWPYTVDIDGDSEVRPGFAPRGHYIRVLVHEIMETGMAIGNGYLWTKPTRKAYPRDPDA